MSPRAAGALAVVLLAAGCRTPLNDNAVTWSPQVNQLAVERVLWWASLVHAPILEFAPVEYASPTVDPEGEQVIALTRDGRVHAVRFGGKEAWTFQTGNRFAAGPTVREGVVYVPGGDGNLYALDAKTGKEKWRYAAGEELVTSPTLVRDLVLVASQTDTIFAVNRESGKWLWQYRREASTGFSVRGASGVTAKEDTAFAGFSDGHVVALALVDGQVKWDQALSPGGQFGDVDTTPVLDDEGRLYVASFREGVFQLDASTGEMRWQSRASGINHLVKRGGLLFVTGADRIEARFAGNGNLLWTLPLKDRAAQAPAFVLQYLAVPTSSELLFLDALSGKPVLEWDPGKGVTAGAAFDAGNLFVLSNSGVLYALDIANAH